MEIEDGLKQTQQSMVIFHPLEDIRLAPKKLSISSIGVKNQALKF
jgi:hypothetical protein